MITTGLNGTDCLPQYAISDDMVCTGRISGLDITDNGSTITIGAGSAYVKTTDASGFEMNVKVYLDTDETVTKANNSDIIILVPLANVQNAQNNTDFSNIASLDVVPTSTGGDFHLVLATINGSGVVSDIVNAGHYLPGCDFCMRCENGVLQLADINANDATFNDVNANDITATGQFNGDASGLFNLPNNLDTVDILLGEDVSQGDYLRLGRGNIVQEFTNATTFSSSNITGVNPGTDYQLATFTTGDLPSIISPITIAGKTTGGTAITTIKITDASNNVLYTGSPISFGFNSNNVYAQTIGFNPIVSLSPNTNYKLFVSVTGTQLGLSYISNSADGWYYFNLSSSEDSNAYFKTDASDSNTIDWVGVAEISGTSGSTISMVYSPSDPFQTGLTIGDTMYLSDTPGAVSNTPGTNESQVGSVISSTEILFNRNSNTKSRTSILNNVTYTADKDGTVNALTISNTSFTTNLEGFVNGGLVSSATSIFNTARYSISFEVLKGETYRVNFNGLPVTYASFIS